MGKLLNGRLLEDLMLSDALASGAFDQVPCQHTGEFDKKNLKCLENAQGLMVSFEIDWYIIEPKLVLHH